MSGIQLWALAEPRDTLRHRSNSVPPAAPTIREAVPWQDASVNAPAVTPEPLQLVVGEEELLVERAVRAALDAARLADPTADMTRIRVAELTVPQLTEMV